METILQYTPELYFSFFLIVLRLSGLFITAPILSADNIPIRLRVLLVVLISMIMVPALPQTAMLLDGSPVGYAYLVVKELLIGLMLGLVPRMIFAAIDLAGTLVGFQMGLSIANVMDPLTNVQTSVVATFKGVLATLLFITLDGHHVFLEAFSYSYSIIPVNGITYGPEKIEFILRLGAEMMQLGIKLAAPLMVSLLFANVIMGFMARAMPQMNIFIVGFPFSILLGFTMLLISISLILTSYKGLFATLDDRVLEMIKLISK